MIRPTAHALYALGKFYSPEYEEIMKEGIRFLLNEKKIQDNNNAYWGPDKPAEAMDETTWVIISLPIILQAFPIRRDSRMRPRKRSPRAPITTAPAISKRLLM